MDDRKHPISPQDFYARIGADAAPIVADVRRAADQDDELVVPVRDHAERLPADCLRESPLIVYCGNAQQVSEGFAIALRAMGAEANFLQGDIALPTTNRNREDN